MRSSALDVVLRPRGTVFLVLVAAAIGALYVGLTFNAGFLAGRGPFWTYPVGPWLMDAADRQDNLDVLDYLVAYTGFVRSPWGFPPFHVANIGAPAGTSVVFLDVVPIVALVGKLASGLAGTLLIPYGAWVGLCFVLSPVFAALLFAEWGQRSLLATIAGSIFAVSAPTLLHRFGHFPLMAQFLVIGGLYLYAREQRGLAALPRLLSWLVWLLLALLTNPYMFAMVGALYGASLLRSWRVDGIAPRLLEPILIGAAIGSTMFALGFIGSGAALSGGGFGFYSMNLGSPFFPQRSGLFPSMTAILDSTGGQYEGFNYLGFGSLVLLVAARAADPAGLRRALAANRELAFVLLALTLYALTNRLWLGGIEILRIDLPWKVRQIAGIYRSSGRLFWPVYYTVLLGSLCFVLARMRPSRGIALVAACCILQLIDAEPLRARLTALTSHGGTPLLDQAEWSGRIEQSSGVDIHPTFFCSDGGQQRADMELQLLAIRADRGFNVAYNPRLNPDCDAEAKQALAGPWSPTTLYVFLDGEHEVPRDWSPPGLACRRFAEGRWCLGRE